ncbi:uncharacterized protein MONBRDRAFT_26078 [Monosiga brevicollis MX1]|uniref:Fe2OG dioxygenase domain-containing protein n=1 Tax=Monosiga brevicollis TaxID=81824 RepID=A9V1B1_MONBE|nr:uncharacterized protein MONBRDRAFT_26078 [Monosiga brevicollis MX1]EDQ88902.1 predicted protein [Monosiga brevicollis MX1]|eukprot:XP_001746515.1 hypothetical protein [Monosiga brevicollis MX1]
MPFTGVRVWLDFVTEAEETALVAQMDAWPWTDSQSGRRKQDFGPKANFKKKKVKAANFTGLPALARPLIPRLQALTADLKDFVPVEQCHLDYEPSRGAAIVPHFDDFWLWGERLITLNLLSTTFLCFQLPDEPDALEIAVPLPPRSLLEVKGVARMAWHHAVHRQDVSQRRIAMTWRELTPEFLSGERQAEGHALLDLAATYTGLPM